MRVGITLLPELPCAVDWERWRAAGRAAALGHPDVVIGWPRPDGPMAGDPALLETVAARLPEVHALQTPGPTVVARPARATETAGRCEGRWSGPRLGPCRPRPP